jgi:aspartyl-tRNA(Asn)/glutamyl-tRNA(Gln) amidotransferase subunit A
LLLQVLAKHDPADPASVRCDVPNYRAALTGDIRGLKVGVVRQFLQEDAQASPDVVGAVDEAVEVYRSLGAICEDVRLAPLQDYCDAKMVVAESELFAVHRSNLCTRPGDFGQDFLIRCLPACLFTSIDYVEAQRQRRELIAAIQPVYESYDVLLTAGNFTAAPRLDAHQPLAFWQHPNIRTPFNVTGGPALAMCAGFNEVGLPLSLQLAGRPFDDATVLRAAHAYESATPWRSRRPPLVPGATPEPLRPPITVSKPEPTRELMSLVSSRVKASGLLLEDAQMTLVNAAAPYALAMSERIRANSRAWGVEPASIFVPGV